MKIADIKELASLASQHGLNVSLYLNIDKTHQDWHDLKTNLNHLINEQEKNMNVPHDVKKHLRADLQDIWHFFNTGLITKNKRGLAIFSNSEQDYFKHFYFTKPVANRVLFSQSFLVRPLIRYLDDNARIMAVFVDQARGRLVELDGGEIARFIEFEDEVPKKVKAGTHYGLADKRIDRHVEWHIQKHLKRVARLASSALRIDRFDWLFVYGKGEELTEFEHWLHSYPKQKIVFEEHVDMLESGKEDYFNKIQTTIGKVKEAKHHLLNDELFEDFPHRAVLGINDVNFELDRKSVFKLLLSNRFSRVYPVCEKCDYLLHDQLICPNCHADMSLIDWESNELVRKALFQDSEVNFIDSSSLDNKGGIGAILRYEAAKKAA